MRPRRNRALATLLLPALLILACAKAAGPPPIVPGTPCAACGMEVRDLRFACERKAGGAWRVYDAIECLVRELGTEPSAPSWLADYDHQTLHAADSLWVVRGEFPSPMGGGFAAFLDRAVVDSIAAATHGRVDRLSGFLAAPAESSR